MTLPCHVLKTTHWNAGFTLIEVVLVVLILALGLGSAMGLATMARKWAGGAQGRFTGTVTASTVLYDREPLGLTADLADADDDGWEGSGTFSWTGAYTLRDQGHINGFWVSRVEESAVNDIIDARRRWATVTVEVFWGIESRYITTQRERILREAAP
jgi:prepilin-type N-terminal cleavage/methylation domain-containing protein